MTPKLLGKKILKDYEKAKDVIVAVHGKERCGKVTAALNLAKKICDTKCQHCGKPMSVPEGSYFGILCSECSKPGIYTSSKITELEPIKFGTIFDPECEFKECCADRGVVLENGRTCDSCEHNKKKEHRYKPRKRHLYNPWVVPYNDSITWPKPKYWGTYI